MLDSAIEILKQINESGYEGYIVGGFVRDYLLGILSSDIDIATNMPIEELERYFNVNSCSIKHGSFTLLHNNYTFEITLFRKELSYSKKRHPEIEYVNSFKEDFVRRDFTVNALGFDSNMTLIDYCYGLIDLSSKTIKTIREPNLTFTEDPVRILRAIYFKNKYGFKYDKNTYKSIISNSCEVSSISNKRLFIELNKFCKFKLNLFIDDLLKTKVAKNINLDKEFSFIKKNNIIINDVVDIIYVSCFLGKDISKWEISSTEKKDIVKAIDIVSNNFNNRILFDNSKDVIDKACYFTYLLNKEVNTDALINKLVIKSVDEIDFNFKELLSLVDKKEINSVKDMIINNILNKSIENTYESISDYISKLVN